LSVHSYRARVQHLVDMMAAVPAGPSRRAAGRRRGSSRDVGDGLGPRGVSQVIDHMPTSSGARAGVGSIAS